MAGCCERYNEHSSSIKYRDFRDYLRHSHLLKKDSAALSLCVCLFVN